MKEAEGLKKGQEILYDVKELMGIIPDLKTYQKRDMIDWIGKDNEEDPVLPHIDRIARGIVSLLKEENFTKSSDPYLEQHISYLLQSNQ